MELLTFSLLVGYMPVLLASFGTTGEANFMEAMQARNDFFVDETVDLPSGKLITYGAANVTNRYFGVL